MGVLSFIVTRKCNADCHVCIVEKKNAGMTSCILRQSIARFRPEIAEAAPIRFFGGEALLEFDLIREGYSLLKEIRYGGSFEIGTNGLNIDENKIRWILSHDDIQVNVNAWFRQNPLIKHLKNIIWNLCVPNDCPHFALERLESLFEFLGKGKHRINVIPAAYCVWSPAKLRELNSTLKKIFRFIKKNALALENLNRGSDTPLINNSLTIDIDGKFYISDLCLVSLSDEIRNKLIYSREEKKICANSYLVDIFGMEKASSSFAASRILQKNIEEFF